MEIAVIVAAAFLLDCLFGDPSWIPHPIRLIGLMISGMERVTRKLFPKSAKGEYAAGLVMCIITAGVSFAVPLMLIWWLSSIDVRIGWALQLFWCWQIFAARSLSREGKRVGGYIKSGDLDNSRKYLSWIVGRDTQELTFPQITKAVVETVAENASDGVIAPMIFMAIGGAPAGFLYKAVNTMDSMVGYKNDKYINFGRFAAKTDDVFNFIPARLTGLAMAAGAAFTGLDAKGSLRIFKRDRMKHASPNSGNPEAACAGALGVQLGGDACYFGKLYHKNTLGDDLRPIEAEDIDRACRLMYAASVLMLAAVTAVRLALVAIC
jgi:cobalamin biosynthesis protein CobD